MKSRSGRAWLAIAYLAILSQGCGTLGRARAPYRDDPLLLSRKPVMGKPEDSKPLQPTFVEPSLPTLPEFAYVYPPRPELNVSDSTVARNPPADRRHLQTGAQASSAQAVDQH
jgi:hypothetical protein